MSAVQGVVKRIVLFQGTPPLPIHLVLPRNPDHRPHLPQDLPLDGAEVLRPFCIPFSDFLGLQQISRSRVSLYSVSLGS